MGNRRHFAVIVLIAALTVAGTSWRRALEASPAAPPLVAPDTLIETGLYEAGRPGVVAAAISRSRRSIRCGATAPASAGGSSCRLARRSTRASRRVGLPGWHQAVEGVRVRRPQGGDAILVEGQRQRSGRLPVTCGMRRAPTAVKAPEDGLPRVAEIAPGKSHASRRSPSAVPATMSNRTEVLGLQRAAALHGPRSECDSWRTARARHGDPGDAGERRTPDAGADRPRREPAPHRGAQRRRTRHARLSRRQLWCLPQPQDRPGAARAALEAGRARRRRAPTRPSGCWRTARSGRCPACPTARAC